MKNIFKAGFGQTISGLMGVSATFLALAIFFVPSISHALTVSPARIEIAGDPGQKVSGQFTLINEQTSSQTFYSSAENFEAQGESGAPSFVSSIDGLASWISVAPTITLAKNQEVVIPFSIAIPKDAEPGGYFSAIFLSTNSPRAEKGQVSVGARIGVLVLLKVSGTVKEGGGLTSFGEQSGSRFFTSLPITFDYRFRNSGGDRVKPDGTLTIRDTIGLSVASLGANDGLGNILPNSTRKFKVTWNSDDSIAPSGFWNMVSYEASHFALGPYFAHLHLTYGSQKVTADSTYLLFVFPWQLLLVALVIISIVVFLITNGLKRYNRWIIRKAQDLK